MQYNTKLVKRHVAVASEALKRTRQLTRQGQHSGVRGQLLFGPPARGPIHFGQKDRNIRCPHSPLVLPLMSRWKLDLQLSLSLF